MFAVHLFQTLNNALLQAGEKLFDLLRRIHANP
jgi:type VI protein secretion system component VasF